MQTTTKRLLITAIALIMGLAINTSIKAQTPANDPGIFGPGSPGNGPQGDGSPVVPFDGGMSLMLIACGVKYAAMKLKIDKG